MGKYKFTPEDFEKPEVHISTGKKGRWWKKPLSIAAAFAILCGVGYGGYLLLNNDPEEPVKNGLISQESKKPEEASMVEDVSEERDTNEIMQVQTTENTENDPDDNATVIVQQAGSTTAEDNPSGEDLHTLVLNGSLEQKAKHVIRGDFGNGQERKDKLGSEYETIQSKVNELYRKGDLFM